MSSRAEAEPGKRLELLVSLSEAVSEFAKREEALLAEMRSHRYSVDRRQRQALERCESALASHIELAGAAFEQAEERIRAVHESRRGFIERTRAQALRDIPKRGQEAKKRFLGDLQMRHFRGEKKLAAMQEAADRAQARTAGFIGEMQSAREDLERRARSALGGFASLLAPGRRSAASGAVEQSPDPEQIIERLREHLQRAEARLAGRRFVFAPLFRFFPYPLVLGILLLTAIGCAATPVILHLGPPRSGLAGIAALAALFLAIGASILYWTGRSKAKPFAAALAEDLAAMQECETGCADAAVRKQAAYRKQAREEFEQLTASLESQWNRGDEVESEERRRRRAKLEIQAARAYERNASLLLPRLRRNEEARDAKLERAKNEVGARRLEIGELHVKESAKFLADESARWETLQREWAAVIAPLYAAIERMNSAANADFPAWSADFIAKWDPARSFTHAAKFGRLELDLAARPGGIPRDPRLALPGPATVSLPLMLRLPEQGSLLFETHHAGGETVIGAFNNIILRLLTTIPPGKLSFTIIDPVELGQNFAGLMHLADYEESLIDRRIWTQRDQIEERLGELSAHIEKVIQMYLRNEYATITEYNEQAGSVAEKYHFLVIADFPSNFSDIAAKRLRSIALSGPRCGIFTLIHWDQRQPLPDGFVPDELRKNSVRVRRERDAYFLSKEQIEHGITLAFDLPPPPELAVELIHKIGKSSIDSNRVEVPFSQIAPKPEEMWTTDTTSELRIPIGRTGATKLQYLAIGKGTRQHALFAGKTGSGKSTLFHVIITNLALACSPEQVEFYLIDFKKGVEFKCYATKRLPHARVIAIESDREFGLNVLQRVDDELKRRGDLFRKLGVQDIPGYKRAGGAGPMPRTLLIIDEFQEFFVEDDAIAQTGSLLFDRIVRQGRAFGIHVLLGSQTLGGAYSLARATLGQMVIRVALQCNEADAYLIMDENNSAPRLLSRPGEGIYNDAAGASEGNSPFQVVWLPDDERDLWLDRVQSLAESRACMYAAPIVFEGNAPADIRDNELLVTALDSSPSEQPQAARCWLGAPNSIKGPAEVLFRRQSGNNLLIVGQREACALALLGLSLIALAAQYPTGSARFYFFHAAVPGSHEAEFIDSIVNGLPGRVIPVRAPDVGPVMNTLSADLKSRDEGDHHREEPAIFVLMHGIQKFKKLRPEDDFSFSSGDGNGGSSPGAQFTEMICGGSTHGIHILAAVDTFNNVGRCLSRKALSEFEVRVVFQMSANDSVSLIDNPKASGLGLLRALLYNEHDGTLETFRPYTTPETGWLRETLTKVGQRTTLAAAVV